MKIISKVKDYYDNGMLYGIDEKVVFVRTVDVDRNKIEYLNHNFNELPSSHRNWRSNGKIYYNPIIVYFCGKTYIGYKIDTPVKERNRDGSITVYATTTTSYAYGEDIINTLKTIPEFKDELEKGWSWIDHQMTKLNDTIEKFHDKPIQGEDLLMKYNVPYLMLTDFNRQLTRSDRESSIVNLNISLKEINFQQVKNPVEAFQEVSMFIPLLQNREEISEMSDAQKIHSHGLDETSFRCEAPGNKKHRRKANKLNKRKKI